MQARTPDRPFVSAFNADWSRCRAQRVLDVRTQVLDGTLENTFPAAVSRSSGGGYHSAARETQIAATMRSPGRCLRSAASMKQPQHRRALRTGTRDERILGHAAAIRSTHSRGPLIDRSAPKLAEHEVTAVVRARLGGARRAFQVLLLKNDQSAVTCAIT